MARPWPRQGMCAAPSRICQGRDKRPRRLEALARLASRNQPLDYSTDAGLARTLQIVLLLIEVRKPKHTNTQEKQTQATHEIENNLDWQKRIFHVVLRFAKIFQPFYSPLVETQNSFVSNIFGGAAVNPNNLALPNIGFTCKRVWRAFGARQTRA